MRGRFAFQDLLVQSAQLGPGVRAELLHQPVADEPVVAQASAWRPDRYSARTSWQDRTPAAVTPG
ncbi:hypothetical protein GCM10010492_50680 [Saccharothrix mutabilis subsp. mutabilis]|uniref:Uncharacterized protein n=1 Tax=Saccharothrix mutabilis subsp. mutabilis TaxID=66855 RepID=A0ABN0UBL9_9PSEU